MIQTVPVSTIAVSIVTAVITAVIPIITFIVLTKKTKCRQNYVLVGVGAFVVFALILESLFNMLISRFFGRELTENIYLYALYGGLAAGLFEETGRFISMKLFMKKDFTKANSLMYGVGHGGAEAIIIGCMTYISNAVLSVLINLGQFEPILRDLDEATKAQVIKQYSALWTSPSYEFLLAGTERITAFALQLCLSYIVYRAIKDKKFLLFFLAVALHFAVDAGIVLLAKNISVYAAEGLLFAFTACLFAVILKFFKAEKEAEEIEA